MIETDPGTGLKTLDNQGLAVTGEARGMVQFGMKKHILPPVERLRELLDYDPETGRLTWRLAMSARVRIGEKAGCLRDTGYLVVGIDGEVYRAHRVIWKWMTGADPDGEIDHRDLQKTNNRWTNLREAERPGNAQNRRAHRDNAAGLKGVSFEPSTGRWKAQICVEGKQRHIGRFDTAADAHAAYCAEAERLHGEFART